MTVTRGNRLSTAFCISAALVAVIVGPSVRADAADHPVDSETDLRPTLATAVESATITYESDESATGYLPANRTTGAVPGNDRTRAQVTPAVAGASPDAVYSNLATFRDQSFAPGGATQQVLNTITRLAADDLNLIGTPPYSINGFRFIVTNLNAVDVSARPLVRFYLPNGSGGGPGTLLEARTYNPIVFTAGRVGTIKTSSTFVLRSSAIWAGITFDNNGGATGATAAQLDNLALGIFSPPVLGTSADRYFVTTAAGSFASNNPAGTIANFGGAPPADFGWEILTAQNVDLSIANSDGVSTAFPGGSVVYSITASNAGPDTVFDARVVDTFPASLNCSWTCAGSAGNACATSGAGAINDATVSLAVGGSVTYTATCAVSPAATGTLVNTATIFAPGTAVETNLADNSATDSDTLTVIRPPAITKAFGNLGILVNGTTTLTFTLTNPNAGAALSGVGFSDTLPAGLVVATPNGLVNSCGGTVTAVAGTSSISLVNGGLPAGGSCAITGNVTGLTRGLKSNTTSAVTSTEGGTGGTAAAFLVVVAPPAVAPPTIAKAFGAASIVVNGTTALTFSLANPNPGTALSGVGFTDALPAGLVVSTPNGLASTCGGTATAAAGGGAVALASSGLPAGGACAITVHVTGTAAGAKNNTTSAVTSTEGGTGGTASASLAVIAPPTIAKAFVPPGIPMGGTTALTFTLTNPNTGNALTGIGFTDTLPAGLTVASGTSPTCGGTLTASGGNTIALAGATLAPSGTCTFPTTVTGAAGGLKNNVTSAVASTEGGTGGTASASLVVVAPPAVGPPTIAKSFGVSSIPVNGTTTLTFALTNPNTGTALTGVGFTDTLPAGVTVASGTHATCGGTLTESGGNTIALAGATLAASGTCTFSATVTGTTAGAKNNITGTVTSTNGGTGGTASATLTVVAVVVPPTIAKSFGAAQVEVNGTTTLTFALTNPNSGAVLTGVGFSDTLPSGLVVATPNGLTSSCGGTVTATAGGGSVTLAKGTLPASGSCAITMNVTGVTAGEKLNVTSPVTSIEGGTGGTASAGLMVTAAVVESPTIAKAFGRGIILLNETTSLTFTLTNPNPGAALTGVGFTDPLPAGLVVATPNALTSACGGTTIAVSGGVSVVLAGGGLPAGGSCTITLDVTGVTVGAKHNVTSSITSTEGGTGGSATARLGVLPSQPPIPTLSPWALAILALLVAGAGAFLFSRLR